MIHRIERTVARVAVDDVPRADCADPKEKQTPPRWRDSYTEPLGYPTLDADPLRGGLTPSRLLRPGSNAARDADELQAVAHYADLIAAGRQSQLKLTEITVSVRYDPSAPQRAFETRMKYSELDLGSDDKRPEPIKSEGAARRPRVISGGGFHDSSHEHLADLPLSPSSF